MVESTSRQKRRDYSILLVFLVVLGIVLVATTIRGPFTIDEANYLVTVTGLRAGTLFVPGTEGLTPSRELFYFDPEVFVRVASHTPVVSVAPLLYAPIALPFSYLGWRGLALMNTLSYLLTALLVFTLVRRYAAERKTPWIAVAITLFGGPRGSLLLSRSLASILPNTPGGFGRMWFPFSSSWQRAVLGRKEARAMQSSQRC